MNKELKTCVFPALMGFVVGVVLTIDVVDTAAVGEKFLGLYKAERLNVYKLKDRGDSIVYSSSIKCIADESHELSFEVNSEAYDVLTFGFQTRNVDTMRKEKIEFYVRPKSNYPLRVIDIDIPAK